MRLGDLLAHERWLVALISLFGEDFVHAALSLLNLDLHQRTKCPISKTKILLYVLSDTLFNRKNWSITTPGAVAIITTGEVSIRVLPHVHFCTCTAFRERLFCVHLLAILVAMERFGLMDESITINDATMLAQLLFSTDQL